VTVNAADGAGNEVGIHATIVGGIDRRRSGSRLPGEPPIIGAGCAAGA
jgi:hypothetical protein